MPNPPLPLPATTIQAAWGQAVTTRVVNVYQNAAARDTALPTPEDGQLAYLIDEDLLTVRIAGVLWVTMGVGTFVQVSGDTMEGDLNMGAHEIKAVKDPTATSSAFSEDYADRRYLLRDAISDLDMNAHEIKAVKNPTAVSSAFSQQYGDLRYPLRSDALAAGTPFMEGGWSLFGNAAFTDVQYRKDSAGNVHIIGMLKGGTTTTGTKIFNVPAGFRPFQGIQAMALTDSGTGRFVIGANGDVTIESGFSAAWTSLTAIYQPA